MINKQEGHAAGSSTLQRKLLRRMNPTWKRKMYIGCVQKSMCSAARRPKEEAKKHECALCNKSMEEKPCLSV